MFVLYFSDNLLRNCSLSTFPNDTQPLTD
jgi:hypothetical protein